MRLVTKVYGKYILNELIFKQKVTFYWIVSFIYPIISHIKSIYFETVIEIDYQAIEKRGNQVCTFFYLEKKGKNAYENWLICRIYFSIEILMTTIIYQLKKMSLQKNPNLLHIDL